MGDRSSSAAHPAARKAPGIQWVVGLVVLGISVLGVVTLANILDFIDNNIEQNHKTSQLTQQVALDAEALHLEIVPAVTSLHNLEHAFLLLFSELELLVLDPEHDLQRIENRLHKLTDARRQIRDAAREQIPVEHSDLLESAAIFHDIIEEALQESSPNQRLQLRNDSQDLFEQFYQQLDTARQSMRTYVKQRGARITASLGDASSTIDTQSHLLDALKHRTSVLLLSLLLALVIGSLLLFYILRKRLCAVADYAHDVADGKLDRKIGFQTDDALGNTARSVQFMGQKLADLLQQSQRSAESARQAETVALKLANFDTLTGLPNRTHFVDLLNQSIQQAETNNEKIALVFMDLDDFKKINDSFGHAVGDELLCNVAKRLRDSLRESDLFMEDIDTGMRSPRLCRLGGDEFTFMIAHAHNQREIEAVTQRVIQALNKPYNIDGRAFLNTPSLGVAVFPEQAQTAEDLMQKADMAMYEAKRLGRNTVSLFSETLATEQLRKLELERELGKALDAKQFCLHYQPKVDTNTLKIVGAEALLRWPHPEMGMISPAEFIPIAEESGMIERIGNWVLHQACSQIAAWQQQGMEIVPISVNVSARQIASQQLINNVDQCLELTNIPHSALELELTESVLMQDTELARNTLKQLNERGIQTSLDDFGTGYSSLDYLKKLRLRTLKIDRSFVKDIEHDPEDAAIITAIIGLARNLDIQVVAEGVENETQLDLLKKEGCSMAQGFLFGRPVSAEEFSAGLNKL